jgi:hypothetical protein
MSKTELIDFIKLIPYNELSIFCVINNITFKEFDDEVSHTFLLYCNLTFRQIEDLDNDELVKTNNAFLQYSPSTPDFKSILRQCNGLILDKNSFSIICNSHNKFTPISKKSLLNNITLNWDTEIVDNKNFFYCEDGTTIRLFYDNIHKKWCFATSRCNDASKSYWVSQKNYKELFDEIVEKNGFNIPFNTLEKNMTHFFVLLHKDNRMIIPQENNVIYINKMENLYITNITQICFDNWSSVLDFNCTKKRGYIIRLNKIDYIYEFDYYYNLKKIVGNTNKLNYTYLNYYKQKTTDANNSISVLDRSYPEYKMMFTMVKHCYEKLINDVFYLYIQSHIKHTIIIDKSHLFYKTLMILHKYYKTNNQIITKEVVSNIISSFYTPIIAKLLRWKSKKSSSQPTNI